MLSSSVSADLNWNQFSDKGADFTLLIYIASEQGVLVKLLFQTKDPVLQKLETKY